VFVERGAEINAVLLGLSRCFGSVVAVVICLPLLEFCHTSL
jgi:hypothetical protein